MMNRNDARPADMRNPQGNESVERAYWFVRLAFGQWEAATVPVTTKTPKSSFHVIP